MTYSCGLQRLVITLRASCGAVYFLCIVIDPVCLCVGGTATMIIRNCVHPHQTGFVGKDSDHLQLIKFWRSHAPGKGSAAGQNF